MGVVAVVGTSSSGSVADRGFVARMATEAHTVFDTDYMGVLHDDMGFVHVHPKRILHFSLIRCQHSFLSISYMLYNLSHRVLLIYKIYRIGLQGYLQIFENIKILHHGGLLTGICDTMVAHGHLMGWVHLTRRSS